MPDYRRDEALNDVCGWDVGTRPVIGQQQLDDGL
jgi:hypothetical protein